MSNEPVDPVDEYNLKIGDRHYRAYVGPPEQYDFIGAAQFRLLCTLGMRGDHRLLDFGCGSLRAGRLFMTYLEEGRYFGIEPNKWLIDAAITNQIGEDLIRIKKPSFEHVSDFSVPFAESFDFIVAQSIFSHASPELIKVALDNFHRAIGDDGLIAATFFESTEDHTGTGWVYPGCVMYRPPTILRFARESGLHCTRIPWYHPNGQTWYLLARSESRLPTAEMHQYLGGRILFDPKLGVRKEPEPVPQPEPKTIAPSPAMRMLRRSLGTILPRPVKDVLKSIIDRKAA
jgi:SAM-dependent methyltransferase